MVKDSPDEKDAVDFSMDPFDFVRCVIFGKPKDIVLVEIVFI